SRAENLTAVSAALVFFDRQMKELNVYFDSPLVSQRAAAPLAAAVPSEIPRSFCSGLKFMVVEDHPFQRRIIMSYLLGRGALEVRGFGDAESALEALNAGTCPADIMVLDLSMPGMDGMDLIRSLSGTTHSVALILNSAMSPNLLASIVQIAKRYRVALLGAVGKPLTDANLAPLVALYRSGVTERS
ncbi:MAG: response regulator, partial [Ramlibacter sp.]